MNNNIRPGFFATVFLVTVTLFFAVGTVGALQLTSDAFEDGGEIPMKYSGVGEDISPSLTWSDVPEGTKSFALLMEDPDAPRGTWIHWVIYGISSNSVGLAEGVPREMVLLDGSKQGINSFRWIGYGGPYPPPGVYHRYFFRLYALDAEVDLAPGANKGELMDAIQGHILDEARLIGRFGR